MWAEPLRSRWCAIAALAAASFLLRTILLPGTGRIRFSTANSSGRRNLRRTPLRKSRRGVPGHLGRCRSV